MSTLQESYQKSHINTFSRHSQKWASCQIDWKNNNYRADFWEYLHCESHTKRVTRIHMKQTADRVAHNLEIIAKNFLLNTRRTRIRRGFALSTIYYVVPIVNLTGRILVRCKSFGKNLEILCHLQSPCTLCADKVRCTHRVDILKSALVAELSM